MLLRMVLVPLECSVINALTCNISSGKWEVTPRIFFCLSSLVACLVKNIAPCYGLSLYLKKKNKQTKTKQKNPKQTHVCILADD